MITEERIKELLRPIIAQLFEWSVRVRRPSYGTIEGFVQSTFKSTLYTVAAEAQKKGIDEMKRDILQAGEYVKVNTFRLPVFTIEIKKIHEIAERLKEER